MEAKVSAIFATAENGVIGRDNELPWYLPADFKYFKQITLGCPIIMGRKTYESIGRPLPKRTNIVVTRNENLNIKGCFTMHSLEQAIALAKDEKPKEIFIIGGANIYRQAIPLLDKIYRTLVHIKPIGDTFFDIPDIENWQMVHDEYHSANSKNLVPFSFQTFERKLLLKN